MRSGGHVIVMTDPIDTAAVRAYPFSPLGRGLG
jgi:hypothetical protein